MFQTGWFMESLATQVLVIYIIRSKYHFFKSFPSFWLIFTTLFAVALGWLITFSKFGKYFYFETPSFEILKIIALIVLSYLLVVGLVKAIFYRRFVKRY
jgi:Mg2+-importing ATPase